jgi:protein-S-isoprenylcysteine O-methyltransferase Ste14
MTAGFWWVLLSIAAYGFIHSLLASRLAKLGFERWLGRRIKRYYRLFFSFMALLTFLPVLAVAYFLPDKRIYSIPFPWVALTVLVQLAAAAGLVYGVMQTGVNRFVGLDVALDPHKGRRDLVVTGLYRYVRHPLYTLSFIVLWLMPVMTWNLLALNLGVTAYFIIGSRYEEDKLIGEFGPAYIEYRRRTPAFLPRLTRKN